MRSFLEEKFLEEDEPAEGDLVTCDFVNVWEFGMNRRRPVLITVPEMFNQDIKRHQNEIGFWSNVWFLSDHGNYHLVDLEN